MSKGFVKSPIWQVHSILDFVKSVLIQLIVKENQSVIQLNCGEGVDLGKVLLLFVFVYFINIY